MLRSRRQSRETPWSNHLTAADWTRGKVAVCVTKVVEFNSIGNWHREQQTKPCGVNKARTLVLSLNNAEPTLNTAVRTVAPFSYS